MIKNEFKRKRNEFCGNTMKKGNYGKNEQGANKFAEHNLGTHKLQGRKNFKKRRSFMQTVKKRFLKEKPRDVGTRLEDDDYNYFLRVLELSRQEFPNEEEKRAFIENVFAVTEGSEIKYSKNQLVTRIIEDLLPNSSETTLERYISAFSKEFKEVSTDRFACYVTKCIVRQCSKHIFSSGSMNLGTQFDPETLVGKCYLFVVELSDYLLNDLQNCVKDQYGSSVIRTTLLCLSGWTEDANDVLSVDSLDAVCKDTIPPFLTTLEELPDKFISHLKRFTVSILDIHTPSDFVQSTIASVVLQTLMVSLYRANQLKKVKLIIQKLLDCVYNPKESETDIFELLTFKEAEHLFDKIIMVSSDKMLLHINERFSGKWVEMAVHRTANRILQKFINKCSDKNQFIILYEELEPSFEGVVNNRYVGVLLSICKACCRLSVKEKEFTKSMMTVLTCQNEEANFFLQLIKMERFDSMKSASGYCKLNTAATLLVQEMMKFQDTKQLLKSILNADTSKLVQIFSDPKGSYIVQKLFSEDVKKEKIKIKLIDKLKGHFVALVTSRPGLYIIESVWPLAKMEQKIAIAKELSENKIAILNTLNGKKIDRIVSFIMYEGQPKIWEQRQKHLSETRNMFADIIK